MAIQKQIRDRIQALRLEYGQLKAGKDSLLHLLDEAEIAEAVYNSNAIENSTLTLQERRRYCLSKSWREMFQYVKFLRPRT